MVSNSDLKEISTLFDEMNAHKYFYSNVLLVSFVCAVVFSMNYACSGHLLSGLIACASIAVYPLAFYRRDRYARAANMIESELITFSTKNI